MEQHEYFALALKARHDRVPILADDGIIPTSFLETGLRVRGEPGWECNRDADGEAQLFQVYRCVDCGQGGEGAHRARAMPNMCTDVRRCQELKMPVF
jgi:ribonuclease T2